MSSVADDTELFITLTPSVVGRVKSEEPETKLIQKINPVVNEDIKDPVLRYSKIVQKRILDKFSFPNEAKEAGFEGTVKLSLKLSHQGDLLDLQIKDSSGFRVIDDDALKTAQTASPYPPFPPAIKEEELWVDIPIIYQLE